MFGAELAELHDAHPGYQLRLRSTRTEGRLDLHQLADVVPDWDGIEDWLEAVFDELSEPERRPFQDVL